MGRAAKFKKGQLIRRKAKSKSISSSTNNNHHQPNPTKSTVKTVVPPPKKVMPGSYASIDFGASPYDFFDEDMDVPIEEFF